MRIGRNKDQRRNAVVIQVGRYVFEEVDDFKYLGTNLSSTNDNHEEIKKTHDIRKQMFLRPFGVIGNEATVEKIKGTTLHGTS